MGRCALYAQSCPTHFTVLESSTLRELEAATCSASLRLVCRSVGLSRLCVKESVDKVVDSRVHDSLAPCRQDVSDIALPPQGHGKCPTTHGSQETQTQAVLQALPIERAEDPRSCRVLYSNGHKEGDLQEPGQ